MVLHDLIRGEVIRSTRLASGAMGQLIRRLVLFAERLPDVEGDLAPQPITENPREKPVEHLRRAIASARGLGGVVPDPQVYSELRLLLNQIESGRVSAEPSRALAAPPSRALAAPPPHRLLQKKSQRRLSVRGVMRFARRVVSELR